MPDEYANLREQMLRQQMMADNMGESQEARPVTPTPTFDTTPPKPQRTGAQERLRQQREAEKRTGSTPGQVVLEQTDTYQPTQNLNGQPAQPAQPTQAPPPIATETIINTTQTQGDKPTPNIKLIGICAAVVVVVGVLCIIFLGGGRNQDDASTPTEPNLDELDWIDPVNQETFLYAPEQISGLRAAGYTGDEIEIYQAASTDYDELIKRAEAERDAWLQEAIAPLYDTASDEYKHYISQTWLTLPQRTDMAEWTTLGAYYSERKNLDYEKIDVYGNQLFIKIFLDDNVHQDWFFLCVGPDEWNKLQDKGNVIVNYTYCTRLVGDDYLSAVEDTENIYITQASLEIIE